MSLPEIKSRAAVGPLDPVTIEVIASALSTIAEEMGKTLVRAAYSFTVKERVDCSTAIFDFAGRTLVQAEHIPMHLGSLMGAVEEIVASGRAREVRPGDVFVCNDAYVGASTHLNDIVLAEPIFCDGRPVGWVTNTAHHSDFIDRGTAHIFQEGLRIPPILLYREGVLQQDVMALILLNCQIPAERVGDFRAQMACNKVGIERFQALCAKYGTEVVLQAADQLLDYSERRTRAGIERIADGVYSFEDDFDTSLIDTPLHLKVEVEVRGSDIYIDLTDNPEQLRASINAIPSAVLATVYFTVKTLIDQDIVPNSGFYRPIHVISRPGTIFHAVAPAAIFHRQDILYRLVDMIRAALSPAVPERVIAGCTGGVSVVVSGTRAGTGRFFAYTETVGGGFGARLDKDGLDGVQPHMTNSQNIPIEALESEWPCVVERYELVTDSGGAGVARGGLAIRRRIRVTGGESRISAGGTCAVHPPRGLRGGLPGRASHVELSPGAPPLANRRSVLQPGQALDVISAGGGGVGDPRQRDRARVVRDVREGRISKAAAREVYGLDDGEMAFDIHGGLILSPGSG